MRNVLLQLDPSPHPSVFDRVVAIDAGVDDVVSCGNVTEAAVRDLVYGLMFTRGPKDLHQSAIFIGGPDVAAGERLLGAVIRTFTGPFRVSVMLDPNGSNTTAAASVTKLRQQGPIDGRRVVVIGGTGAVGMRAAGLLARAGAAVTITSDRADRLPGAVERIQERFGAKVDAVAIASTEDTVAALAGAELILSAGPPGARIVPKQAWQGRAGLRVVADVNAVPPLGVEGIQVMDDGAKREGIATFGAIGIGNFKMKVHKASVARLFERNDLVLDAETIAQIADRLAASSPSSS